MSLPWIKVFAAVPTHAKSKRLGIMLNKPRAWTHVVELWLWASTNRPDGDLSDLEDEAIASCAGWSRAGAARFVEGLVSVGFLTADKRLHQWAEYQPEHAAQVGATAAEESPADRRRRLATERMRRFRAIRAQGVVTAPRNAVTDASDAGDATVTPSDASSDAAVTPKSDHKRAHAKKEIQSKKETEETSKHGAGDLFGESVTDDSTEAKITAVLTAWANVTKQPRPIITGRGSGAKRSIIRARLAENHGDEQELIRALNGWLKDDYYVSGGYSQVDNIFRSRERVEKFLAREAASAAIVAPRPASVPLRGTPAPVAPTPPRPEYWKPPPPPPFDPHAELAGVEAKRSITGTHAQIIWLPEGAEWPADLAIPDGVTLKRREVRS